MLVVAVMFRFEFMFMVMMGEEWRDGYVIVILGWWSGDIYGVDTFTKDFWSVLAKLRLVG